MPSLIRRAAGGIVLVDSLVDTLCGVNFVPDEFADITEEIVLKIVRRGLQDVQGIPKGHDKASAAVAAEAA